MLTKSVKSVISVGLKHVARTKKKIRAIGVIRECYNIRKVLPYNNQKKSEGERAPFAPTPPRICILTRRPVTEPPR